MIKVELDFKDTTVSSIAGFNLGKEMYELNKDKIDLNCNNILIVFPKYKNAIASSFIEGFFGPIIEEIGIDEFRNKIDIEADERIKRRIKRCLWEN